MEGDILTKMRLDIADVIHNLNRVEKEMRTSMAKIEKRSTSSSRQMVKDSQNFMHVSRGHARTFSADWFKRFGEVAVGFTLAYRAMNAVQTAIERTLKTFVDGLVAIDEFRMGVISIAASLQMLTEVPSKKSLEAYLSFGETMFKKMEILAVRHFATGEQLQMAFTKMSTLGIVPQTTQQLESMAALVDRILMATKGLDAGRQILTEVQAVIEGIQRPGAVVARELKSLVPHYKELIAAMQSESNIVKRTEMFLGGIAGPLDAVSSVSKEIMKTHQAWLASLKTAATIVLRSGLQEMYDDLLNIMRSMVNYLIDENGLTEQGIQLAYLYHSSWKGVLGVMIQIRDTGKTLSELYKTLTFDIPIMTSFFSSLSMGITVATWSFKSFIAVVQELKKSLGPAEKSYAEYLNESYQSVEEHNNTLGEKVGMHLVAFHNWYGSVLHETFKETKKGDDLLTRLADREAILFAEMADDIERKSLALGKFLDPKKYEKFAASVKAQSKSLTKDILGSLKDLTKGSGEVSDKDQKARLRRDKQLLTLERQMRRDAALSRFQDVKTSLDLEFQERMKKLLEWTDAKGGHDKEAWKHYQEMQKEALKKRCDFEALALLAHTEKLHKAVLGKMQFYTEEYYNWKRDQILIDSELLKSAGALAIEVERWKLDRLKELQIEQNQHTLETTEGFIEAGEAAWGNYILNAESAMKQVADLSIEVVKTFAQGVGDAYARAVIYGENLTDGLKALAEEMAATIISSLIRIGIEKAIQWAMDKLLGVTSAISKMGALAMETYGAAFASSCMAGPEGVVAAPAVATGAVAAMLGGAKVAQVAGAVLGATSADLGGISMKPELIYSGVPEAYVPLKDGNIPVKLDESREPVKVNILNVLDPTMIEQYLYSSKGQDAIINVIGNRSQSVRRVLR